VQSKQSDVDNYRCDGSRNRSVARSVDNHHGPQDSFTGIQTLKNVYTHFHDPVPCCCVDAAPELVIHTKLLIAKVHSYEPLACPKIQSQKRFCNQRCLWRCLDCRTHRLHDLNSQRNPFPSIEYREFVTVIAQDLTHEYVLKAQNLIPHDRESP
jgi:hypothetical protein